jgi:DNA (cytosine-5)-methyltransferase 1
MHKLKVAELFAGVGGFRLGLEKTNAFEVVFSNQWEPSTKTQHASMVYEARFGIEGHSNQNIELVPTKDIPDHDVLVGGFPCQDYSVATSLVNSKGLKGKKGVLWWQIHRILAEKTNKPKFLFLENVDRLLKSPSAQRGRDFAIMLRSLSDLGYITEWRVINAADYGMPQRRRRVFLVAYHNTLKSVHKKIKTNASDWLLTSGAIANAFPIARTEKNTEFEIEKDLMKVSSDFNLNGKSSPFQNTGICIEGKVVTLKSNPKYNGPKVLLNDVLEDIKIPDEFFIDPNQLKQWEYLKGAKKEIRTSKSGYQYHYSEGKMVFPDALDQPSRTIITGEGGVSPSRFKHVVKTKKGLRRLTPLELERLNMFPDNHTELNGISNTKRAFFMGNALVVGVVEKIGIELQKIAALE